jgi:hypothetical protein
VYVAGPDGLPVFRALGRLKTDEVADVVQITKTRVLKALERRGVVRVSPEALEVDDAFAARDPVLAHLAAAAVSGLPPAGPAERKREPLALAVHGGVRSHPGGASRDFMARYRAERFHQGLGGQLIQKPAGSAKENGVHGKVIRRSRLGGMLSFYVRGAA